MDSLGCAAVLLEEINERSGCTLKMQRKVIKDAYNPFEMKDSIFKKNFGLNKPAFKYVLDLLEAGSASVARASSMHSIHKLGSVLQFLAEGSYQHGVGKDLDVPMAQSTFSAVLKDVLHILETRLCPEWVKLEMTENEEREAKMEFYSKYKIPGVILCVDGTHVKIISPTKEKFLFYNRKGNFSLNAMIMCDHKMRIRYANAQYPGSNHDSHIWNVSAARRFFEKKYLAGERNTFILGDAGYPLEPMLMTPFRSPPLGSPESKFNKLHTSKKYG